MSMKSTHSTNESPPTQRLSLSLLIVGAILIVSGQVLVRSLFLSENWRANGITLIGMVPFIISAFTFQRREIANAVDKFLYPISNWFGLETYQIILLFAAPIFSIVAWLAGDDGMFMLVPVLAVGSWLLAILSFLLSQQKSSVSLVTDRWSREDTYLMLLLFVAALLLRGFMLGELPWLLTGDEASAGLTSIEFIENRRNNIFVVGWFSFPAMFFWVQSLSIKLLGQTTFALRFPSMLAGALTIPALYWFTKPFFGRKVALGSAAFLAGFHFHIHFSRIGLNNIWDGLFVVIFSGMLWRAWNETSNSRAMTTSNFALAGVILGLSQYFYTSVRVLFGILILFVVITILQDRSAVRKRLPGLTSLLIGFMVVVIPLAAFYIQHPEQFSAPFTRVAQMGPWLQEEVSRTGQSAVVIMATKFKQATLAFTHVDIRSWYAPEQPMLLAVPAALFILGFVILLVKLRQPIYQWLTLWLLSAIFIIALSESTPAAQRLTFVAPAVALLVALPLNSILNWLTPIFRPKKNWILILVFSLLAVSIIGDISFYFGKYSVERRFGDVNTEVAQSVAQFLNSLEGYPIVFFYGLPRMGYYTHSTINYLAPHASGQDIPDPLSEPPTAAIHDTVVHIFLPERLAELDFVRVAYPNGKLNETYGRNDEFLYTTYLIEDGTD